MRDRQMGCSCNPTVWKAALSELKVSLPPTEVQWQYGRSLFLYVFQSINSGVMRHFIFSN